MAGDKLSFNPGYVLLMGPECWKKQGKLREYAYVMEHIMRVYKRALKAKGVVVPREELESLPKQGKKGKRE